MDETWATTNRTRRYGRGPRPERWVAKVPHGHGRTTTFLAALRYDGWTAPLVIDGAITGELFRAYVQPLLAPTLRPDDLVILDHLAVRKVAGVRPAREAARARLVYLPPYSPDLNPLEPVFAKLRRLWQSAAERTLAGRWDRIGECVDLFAPQECANSLRQAGYRYA